MMFIRGVTRRTLFASHPPSVGNPLRLPRGRSTKQTSRGYAKSILSDRIFIAASAPIIGNHFLPPIHIVNGSTMKLWRARSHCSRPAPTAFGDDRKMCRARKFIMPPIGYALFPPNIFVRNCLDRSPH